MNVEILITEGCPHAPPAIERTREVLERLLPGVEPTVRIIRDREDAVATGFPGSPTVRIDGVDLEGNEERPAAFACRRYGTVGVPPVWLLEAAILRALSPEHVLFLCVANSARSQMAEAIGRLLAAGRSQVSSAGSEPTRIRPEAVTVLEEMEVDPSHQHSKGMEDVKGEVDTVITICAEEVCPAWLGHAVRVHWGLPDPAAVEGSEEERLDAFREVRDELRRRLGVLFGR